MPEPNETQPPAGVTQLEFTVSGKRKQLGLHLYDGDTLVEKGQQEVTTWLQEQIAQTVQQQFGQGVSYTIYDYKCKSAVAADILVSAILKDFQKGTATVQRYGQLDAEGVLKLCLKLSAAEGADAAGPSSSGGGSSRSAASTTNTRECGKVAALNQLWEFIPRLKDTNIVHEVAGIERTSGDWQEVPEGATVHWQRCTFKGMAISKDRAAVELRWDLLVEKVVDCGYLMCNGKVDKLSLRDSLDRRMQQFNKGVENAHRDEHGVGDEKPSQGANRQRLNYIHKGEAAGVEPEADKWHTVYGKLYEDRHKQDPPGSNRYRLPSKLTQLYSALQGGPTRSVTQGVSSGSSAGRPAPATTGRGPQGVPPATAPPAAAVAGPAAGLRAPVAGAAAGVGPQPGSSGAAVAAAAPAAAPGAEAPGAGGQANNQPTMQQELAALDSVLERHLAGLRADEGAAVVDELGLTPGSSGGSNRATGPRCSPRLSAGASSADRLRQRQQGDTMPFGPGSDQQQQQQLVEPMPSAGEAPAEAQGATAAAAAAGTDTVDSRRSDRQQQRQQQQQEAAQQQQAETERQLQCQQQAAGVTDAHLEEIRKRVMAMRASGVMSEVDIRSAVSVTLYDAAMQGMHPTEDELRKQGGTRMVVGKLPTAADRQAACTGRAEAAACRKASKRKRDAQPNSGSGRGGKGGGGKAAKNAAGTKRRGPKAQRDESDDGEDDDDDDFDEEEEGDADSTQSGDQDESEEQEGEGGDDALQQQQQQQGHVNSRGRFVRVPGKYL